MKLLRTLALAAFLPTVALAAPPMTTSQMVDGQGNPLGTLANPFTFAPNGSTGTDFSANAAAVSGTPLVTIPQTASRAYVEVQNQSANQLQLVRDDGNGNNQTSILLSGVGAGQQGGGWSSSTFKGRVRVYGPAGSQIAAYQD
jgi:hypothetical protein